MRSSLKKHFDRHEAEDFTEMDHTSDMHFGESTLVSPVDLFFVGLILLYSVIHDLWSNRPEVDYQHEHNEASLRVMREFFGVLFWGF
jgi:hypothetical protein